MNVQQLYNEAIMGKHESLILVIEWLVYEKQVLKMDRDARNVEHIMKKFGKDLNPHILAFKLKREKGVS